MRYSEESEMVACGCRSAGECGHNNFAWLKAIEALVDDFARHMKKKLIAKATQGKSGWDDPDWPIENIEQCLREHVDKGDPVDVANFAAFLWNRR